MNDDPTSTLAADLPPNIHNGTSSAEAEESSHHESARAQIRKRFAAQTKRRAEFIHDIMFNLDILIYAELCVLYYMEYALCTYGLLYISYTNVCSCSFFRLLLRVLFQVMFLTPKPKFVPPTAKHRPYLGALIGGNIICTLLHIFTHRPEAGELTRDYLHGGIIIDFIGQKGPTSKIHLVVVDLLITALQCFMLAVHVEETRLKEVLAAPESVPLTTTGNMSQDHDAEERGITRDAGTASENIELRELPRSRTEEEAQVTLNDDERAQLHSDAAGRADEDTVDGPLDLYYSGNVIVGEFHVLHTLRGQWEDYDSATTTALHTVGTSAGYHFARVNHRLRRLETLR
jgi:hypothetical protein